QVEWPGILNRPFSGEFRNKIDITYPYASTKGGELDVHHGVEFINGFGTPVRAVADGEVVFSGNDDLTLLGPYTGFYGNVVILRHRNLYKGRDLFSLYAHLSELKATEGDFVNSGDILGLVGASGIADGSHLHFEVRIDENDYDQTVNPVLWFAPAVAQDGTESALLAGKLIDPWGVPLSEFEFVLKQMGERDTEIRRYYPLTYFSYGVNAHPLLDENFVFADIPPGDYRLTFIAGRLYEFEFTLEPGSLGFFTLQLD
ncbi:MAG: M23 family metallopeptidase, partial [Brevefilum sp.]